MIDREPDDMDLGHDHWLRFTCWDPDLRLNPHYAHLADQLPVERWGAIVGHLRPDGGACASAITFNGPVQREVEERPRWDVQSWEPLTMSPSLLCRLCGDHGFIRNGQWVPA